MPILILSGGDFAAQLVEEIEDEADLVDLIPPLPLELPEVVQSSAESFCLGWQKK
jgi:hypothetical protein